MRVVHLHLVVHEEGRRTNHHVMPVLECVRLCWIDNCDVIHFDFVILGLVRYESVLMSFRWYHWVRQEVNVLRFEALKLLEIASHADVIESSLEVVGDDLLCRAMDRVQVVNGALHLRLHV